MSRHTISAFGFGLLILVSVKPAAATGLRSFDIGARAASLGGAFVARADDVSAVFYNAAGLAFLSGLRLKVNIQNSSQSLTARRPDEAATTFHLRPVRTSAFASVALKDRVGLGLGVFPSHSLEVDWPNYWPFKEEICRNRFYAFAYRGAAAVRVAGRLALGLSLDVLDVRQDWTWNNRISELDMFPYYSWAGSVVELKGTGLTFGLGALYEPSRALRVGVRYQHGASLSLKGQHFLKGIGVQEAALRVDLPAEVTAGVRVRPVPPLVLQAEVQWTDWSRASSWRLVLGRQVSGMWGTRMEEGERAVPSRWRDTLSLLCGAEYTVPGNVFVRAGYSRLPAAVSAANLHPFFPDLSEDAFSVGLGYEGPFFSIATAERLGDMSVDVFLRYHRPGSEASTLPGYPLLYSAGRWTAGAGIGFIY